MNKKKKGGGKVVKVGAESKRDDNMNEWMLRAIYSAYTQYNYTINCHFLV